MQVHDRYVQAIPNNTDDWIDHLDALSDQVSFTDKGGPMPYPDLDRLAAALDVAHAALEARRHRLPVPPGLSPLQAMQRASSPIR